MSGNLPRLKIKKKIYVESVMVFFIAISPFLYKFYEYLPSNADGSVSLMGIVIGDHGFADAKTYLWFLTSKLIPLYLFIFWFLTSKNWWYHILIIPIGMYAFQLFEVVFDSDNYVDTDNIWWLLPICMVVIPFVYLIRIRLYDKYVHGIDLEAMEAELMSLKEKQQKNRMQKAKVEHKKKEPANGAPHDQRPSKGLVDYINSTLSTGNIEAKLKDFPNIFQRFQ
ncbi:hypothetical protein [Maribacter sp. 2307ULW6-5]|uniref:hypothetical protein n=1 Tax=Maribacter sp. 2307ULW6-5 TaxID=3386275 RepID=UPI0039BCD33F